MERITKFLPAFDKRDPDPSKDYGIGSVKLSMVLKGELGAVNFTLLTGWYLPEVFNELRNKDGDFETVFTRVSELGRPQPIDIGYHSPKPMFEGQRAMGSVKYNWGDGKREAVLEDGTVLPALPVQEETGTFTSCEYTGGVCYSDGSATNADRYFDILVRQGSDGFWKALEEYYVDTFGELR